MIPNRLYFIDDGGNVRETEAAVCPAAGLAGVGAKKLIDTIRPDSAALL